MYFSVWQSVQLVFLRFGIMLMEILVSGDVAVVAGVIRDACGCF